jgi:superfamily II DNA or RNA helicase
MHQICIPTGGGKTLTMADAGRQLLELDYNILWLAKNWKLLEQAAQTLAQIDPNGIFKRVRIGGDGDLLDHLEEAAKAPDARVFFTTLHTYYRRRGSLPAGVCPDDKLLVVYDESHWAMNAQLGQALLNDHLGLSLVIGLTATPRKDPDGPTRIAHQTTYAQLCGSVLAEPIVRDVATGVQWSPLVCNGLFTARSLRPLAHNADRNQLILSELLEGWNQGRYRRILIFACNVKHANTLCELIARHGVPVRAIHSRISREKQTTCLQAFADGRISVLVNVDMLTEGIDIPAIDTILLARPTESEARLMQMIGRGARLAPGKKSFYVVEFNDTVRRHADQLFHAQDLFQGTAGVRAPVMALYFEQLASFQPAA